MNLERFQNVHDIVTKDLGCCVAFVFTDDWWDARHFCSMYRNHFPNDGSKLIHSHRTMQFDNGSRVLFIRACDDPDKYSGFRFDYLLQDGVPVSYEKSVLCMGKRPYENAWSWLIWDRYKRENRVGLLGKVDEL